MHLPLAGDLNGEITPDPPRSEKYLLPDGKRPVAAPVAFTQKAVWKEGSAVYGAGPHGRRLASSMASAMWMLGNVGNFGFYDSFTLSAWINPAAGSGTIVSRANDEAEGKGLALLLKNGHLSASLVQRWLDDGVRVESEEPVPLNRWSHVSLTYDGSRLAGGVRIFIWTAGRCAPKRISTT